MLPWGNYSLNRREIFNNKTNQFIDKKNLSIKRKGEKQTDKEREGGRQREIERERQRNKKNFFPIIKK